MTIFQNHHSEHSNRKHIIPMKTQILLFSMTAALLAGPAGLTVAWSAPLPVILQAEDDSDEDKTIDQYTPRVNVLKQRMLKRLKAVDQLKYQGIIGENNKGYLEPTPRFKDQLDEKQAELIKEENKDRKEIYTILAKRTETTLLQVQAVRAKIIREKSKRGIWLQDTKNRWYQKR